MIPPAAIEEFQLLLSALANGPGTAIIVEGKKDVAALRKLGLDKERIIQLERRPLFEVSEAVAAKYRDAVILTDLDAEGKKLYAALNSSLQHLGVRIDNRLRNFLFRKTKVRQIEGLIL